MKPDHGGALESPFDGGPVGLQPGQGQIISGREQALQGMTGGEERQVAAAGDDAHGPGNPGAAGLKSGPALAAAGLIFFVHLALLLSLFGGPGKLLSAEPVIRDDHAWHLYYSVISARFLAEHGSTWGYDPYMMAGSPTDLLDASDRLLKLGLLVLEALPPETAYKIISFCTAAAAPILFLLAAAWFGLSRREVVWSCLIGTWAWWTTGPMALFATGLVGFTLAMIYGMAFAALFGRVLRRPSARRWLGLAVAAPFTLLIHPGIVPIAGVPCAVFYLMRFRKMPLRHHLLTAAAAALALVLNLFWIYPLTYNLQYAFPRPDRGQWALGVYL